MFNELEVKWHSNRWLIRSFPYHTTPNNSIVSTTPVICHVTPDRCMGARLRLLYYLDEEYIREIVIWQLLVVVSGSQNTMNIIRHIFNFMALLGGETMCYKSPNNDRY